MVLTNFFALLYLDLRMTLNATYYGGAPEGV